MADYRSDDDDPVVEEYDVFLTDTAAEQLHILQYPTRNHAHPYDKSTDSAPTQVRVKPRSGFVEVDVPLDINANFDRAKRRRWGQTIQKANSTGSTTFGMASGFTNVTAQSSRGTAGAHAKGGALDLDNDSDDGGMMKSQTLGGQILGDDVGKPHYMLGAFQGKEIHLNSVNGIVQMRPQFHHLDAEHQQDMAKRRQQRDGGESLRATEPRAIQTSVKSVDGEENDMKEAKEFLQTAAEESWNCLHIKDQDTMEVGQGDRQRLFARREDQDKEVQSSVASGGYLTALFNSK